MNEEDLEILERELTLIFPQTERNCWHRGEWKQSGFVLFKKRVYPKWNIVLRIIRNRGIAFLEEEGVTKGLRTLNFDKYP